MDNNRTKNYFSLYSRRFKGGITSGILILTALSVSSFGKSPSVLSSSINSSALNQSFPQLQYEDENVVIKASRLPSATIENKVFDTELSAVIHAMDNYNPVSIREDREYIGAVYELINGQGFLYSVAPGRSGSDKVSASIPKLKNARFVSFWHTHGADNWNRHFFSDTDTRLVKDWGLPFYLGCADGNLRVFRPEHKTLSYRQAQGEGLGRQRGYGKGELVKDIRIRNS